MTSNEHDNNDDYKDQDARNNPVDESEVDSLNDPTTQPQDGTDDVGKLRHERDEYYKKLLRATADYRNSQRRLEQDKQQAVQYANSSLIKALLPVIDNFERALTVDPKTTDVTRILQGMQIVHDELLNVLKRQSVEAIAPQAGDPFNPELHQAMMQQGSKQYQEPTVTTLLQKGYTHLDRVLRPAGVAVSKTE